MCYNFIVDSKIDRLNFIICLRLTTQIYDVKNNFAYHRHRFRLNLTDYVISRLVRILIHILCTGVGHDDTSAISSSICGPEKAAVSTAFIRDRREGSFYFANKFTECTLQRYIWIYKGQIQKNIHYLRQILTFLYEVVLRSHRTFTKIFTRSSVSDPNPDPHGSAFDLRPGFRSPIQMLDRLV